MGTQVMILSADATFARMLAIEFELLRLKVVCAAEAEKDMFSEVVLLDLDSAMPPNAESYRHMIGFTKRSATVGDENGRRCSLVLRRPFEIRLMCDEVMTLLGESVREGVQETEPLTAGNRGAHTVRLPDGRTVDLSPKEYAVFSLLLANRSKTVSRERIVAEIGESSSNKADVYICYLRKKLETADRRMIVTVHGAGYRLL